MDTTPDNPTLALSGTPVAVLHPVALAPSRKVDAAGRPTHRRITTNKVVGKRDDGTPVFEERDLPIEYRTRRPAPMGNWTHRGNGGPVTITPDRSKAWAENTSGLLAAGVRPYIPNRHRFDIDPESDAPIAAGDNYGHVLSTGFDDEGLLVEYTLIGEEAIRADATNDVSICIVDGMRDATGRVYGEALQHMAVVPNPALPNIAPSVRIAASGHAPAVDVAVWSMAAPVAAEPKPPARSPAASKLAALLGPPTGRFALALAGYASFDKDKDGYRTGPDGRDDIPYTAATKAKAKKRYIVGQGHDGRHHVIDTETDEVVEKHRDRKHAETVAKENNAIAARKARGPARPAAKKQSAETPAAKASPDREPAGPATDAPAGWHGEWTASHEKVYHALRDLNHAEGRKLGWDGQTVRVRLADLREKVAGIPRADQDKALSDLASNGQVILYRLDDPNETHARDEAAAFHTPSGQERHTAYIQLHVPGPRPKSRMALALAGAFTESKHPRSHGKFARALGAAMVASPGHDRPGRDPAAGFPGTRADADHPSVRAVLAKADAAAGKGGPSGPQVANLARSHYATDASARAAFGDREAFATAARQAHEARTGVVRPNTADLKHRPTGSLVTEGRAMRAKADKTPAEHARLKAVGDEIDARGQSPKDWWTTRENRARYRAFRAGMRRESSWPAGTTAGGVALAADVGLRGIRSKLSALAMCGGTPDCGCEADEPYDPDPDFLPNDFDPSPKSRRFAVALAMAANCGTGAGGFQKGNTCAGGGYGADNKLRTSRTTLGNIKATGAKRTRDYTDGQGRKVVEHRTDDGRLFHEVTHANGRRAFHQVHGASKVRAMKPVTDADHAAARDLTIKARKAARAAVESRLGADSFDRHGLSGAADERQKAVEKEAEAAGHRTALKTHTSHFPDPEAEPYHAAAADLSKPVPAAREAVSPAEASPRRAAEPETVPTRSFRHGASGLEFEREGDKVTVSGDVAKNRAGLRRAGFAEVPDEDDELDVGEQRVTKKKPERWTGSLEQAVNLDVPRAWDLPASLGVRTKGKIGGGRVIR